MSTCCKKEYEICFTDLPLQSVLAEWLIKNIRIPIYAATWLSHIALFIFTWYMIKFTIRLILSILWPFLIICTGLIIFRTLQNAEQEEIRNYLFDKCRIIYHWVMTISNKIPDSFFKLYGPNAYI